MEPTESTEVLPVNGTLDKKKRIRNLTGFWILGLCNNYAYVIMLSAAFDLLNDDRHESSEESKTCNATIDGKCNDISTGAILLADILPSLGVKMIAPFLFIGINTRILIAVLLSSLSFILTSLSCAHWMTFLGVICAALSSGLGELTILSFSSYFEKDVISTWSSGTGGAGVIGALSYASLTHWLSVNRTLQVMLLIPIIMAITFWILIDHPPGTKMNWKLSMCSSELDPMLQDSIDLSEVHRTVKRPYTLGQKINLVKPLLKYMIPLGLVYFAEYFINQGLMELMYFPKICNWLDHKSQYRWYQVDYQFGVLLSRSSVNFFRIRILWILPFLQIINMIFLLFESYFRFLPTIWIVLAFIFYEGLLGGCAYVNTFYQISEEVSEEDKEFSMGVASLGDATGIALAGAVALPVHDALCRLH